MPYARPPGLVQRGPKQIWHIDARIGGRRVCESCRTSDVDVAIALLSKRREEGRKREQFGVRFEHTFEEAATRFVAEFHDVKRSIKDDISLII